MVQKINQGKRQGSLNGIQGRRQNFGKIKNLRLI